MKAAVASALTASIALSACAWQPVGEPEAIPDPLATTTWRDTSPHESRYIEVNGVRLNYLDWGGKGPPLVLVHGIGDDPHVFDDLAEVLRARYHVLAYARRGHGRSAAPAGPYDLDTLVEDLRQLLDRLQISRAHLLGWSTGGNEITELAARYPRRVGKLVYLEAAYDWSDAGFLEWLAAQLPTTSPTAESFASFEAYRAWYIAHWIGKPMPSAGLEAHLHNSTAIDADGRVQTIPSAAVREALFSSLAASARRYSEVRVPALALYASSFLPVVDARTATINAFMQRFQIASVLRISRNISDVTITQIEGTTHKSIGLVNTATLAVQIETFLAQR